MPDSRLLRQLSFVQELDRLKSILRQTLLTDGSRRENDAEHSWHVASMALILAEYAPQGADPIRAAHMLLFHDVVEIDAGDTFIHDDAGNQTKSLREQAAADRLYGILPDDQQAYYRALWQEFEDRTTPTALYADSLDRLQPIMNNFATQGGTWKSNHVTEDKVRHLVARIQAGCPTLGDYAKSLVSRAVQLGYLAAAKE